MRREIWEPEIKKGGGKKRDFQRRKLQKDTPQPPGFRKQTVSITNRARTGQRRGKTEEEEGVGVGGGGGGGGGGVKKRSKLRSLGQKHGIERFKKLYQEKT